jgi:uncharacterized lipoprotein YddW (UPF0748 family)
MKAHFILILLGTIIGLPCHGDTITTGTIPGLQTVYLRPEILTEEAVESYLADIKSWGAKEVFLEVGYDNKVLNHSVVFPEMDPEKDWLRVFCRKAKKYDLKIHAWVKICYWVNKIGSIPDFPLLIKHPEWIDRNKTGKMISSQGTYEDKNFIFVNPAIPGVVETELEYIKEVCTHDIAGISIDYIRFKAAGDDPDSWYGYNSYSIKQFNKKTGLDPLSIEYDLNPDSDFLKWAKYNEQVIENCVKAISDLITEINHEENRNIILSASPFTGYETGKSSKYQNWKSWDEKGYIKLWLPMCMSVDMNGLEEEIRGVQNLGLKSVYHPVIYPNQHDSLHPPLNEHLKVLQKCGIERFAVFSHKQIKQDYENIR